MDSHKKDVPYKWELTSVAASKKRKDVLFKTQVRFN
jgi:hypothetical protein